MRVTRTQEGAFMRLTLTTQPEPGTQYSLQTELGVYMYHAPESLQNMRVIRTYYFIELRVLTTGTGRTHARRETKFLKKRNTAGATPCSPKSAQAGRLKG